VADFGISILLSAPTYTLTQIQLAQVYVDTQGIVLHFAHRHLYFFEHDALGVFQRKTCLAFVQVVIPGQNDFCHNGVIAFERGAEFEGFIRWQGLLRRHGLDWAEAEYKKQG
jgi:hypothetical protein